MSIDMHMCVCIRGCVRAHTHMDIRFTLFVICVYDVSLCEMCCTCAYAASCHAYDYVHTYVCIHIHIYTYIYISYA